MRFTAPQTPAKFSELIEAEGAESIEVLVAAMLSDSVSPAICTNEGCNLTCEMEPDQAPATARSAQQLNAISTHPRRPHLTAEHRPRRVLSWAFLLLDFQLQVPAFTWRFA